MAAAVAKSGIGKSQNGWPASPRPSDIDIVTVAIPLSRGTKSVQLARSAAPALVEMAKWWDRYIEPIDTIYGYNYREIRGYEGTGILSNHSSGTCLDIDAAKYPLGAENTVSTATAIAIAAKAASLGLRWGGSYSGRKDAMHVEVIFSPALNTLATTGVKVWVWSSAAGAAALGLFLLYKKVASIRRS